MGSSDTPISLAEGGIVTVLLGKNVDIPSAFQFHPLVHILDTSGYTPHDVERCFPSNSKAIITTRDLPKKFYDRLCGEVRRRRTPLLYRPTTGSVENELRKITSTAPTQNNGEPEKPAPPIATVGEAAKMSKEDIGKIAARGSVQALAAQADPAKSTAEEGRRLFRLAQAQGIKTTLGSVTQAISKHKRKHGYTDRPASAVAPEVNQRLTALKVLDDAIAGLALVREYVERVEGENQQLKELADRAREAFKSVFTTGNA